MAMIFRMIILLMLIVSIIMTAFNVNQTKPTATIGQWVKLNTTGVPIANWSGPWSCILDKNTGLIWENKDNNEGIHDANWTYSWSDGQGLGIENRGDCNFDNIRCDSQDIIRLARQEKTCGLSQWRLPTAEELITLINNTPPVGEPVIDTDFFPYTKRGAYWTADNRQPLKGFYRFLGQGATTISFIKGKKTATPYRNAAYVRLVTSERK